MMDVEEQHSASDTDSSSASKKSCRLGPCEVCNKSDAKYTCPKCEVKTCALACLQIHKKELNCTGIRDRTKFIPLKSMTKLDFQSDYNFLEECTRYVEARKNDSLKKFSRYNKNLPTHLFRLRNAARDRQTTLRFLLQNFTKHKLNKTFYDTKEKTIFWYIEWIFPNAENLKFTDNRINENDYLYKLMDKYLSPEWEIDFPGRNSLEYYQSCGISGIKILLKAEGIKKSKNRFYELNSNKTLKENLTGKTLVEFPTIYIIFRNDASQSDIYDIIDSDYEEDVEAETKQHQNKFNEFMAKRIKMEENELQGTDVAETEVQENMERLKIAKKQNERRKRKAEFKIEPQNYLFADERMFEDGLLSDSDDSGGHVTEEEKDANEMN